MAVNTRVYSAYIDLGADSTTLLDFRTTNNLTGPIVMITHVQCMPWRDSISMSVKHIEWTEWAYRKAEDKNLGLLSVHCG